MTPRLLGTAVLPNAAGVITLTGTADAGAAITIGEQGAAGWTDIGMATADTAGNWRFSTPTAALGYGAATLAARDTASADTWSPSFVYRNVDPEAGLRHVGADLATRLAADSANRLDATADLQAVADEVAADGANPAVLDIPAGTYIVSSTILLHSGSYLDAPGVTLSASDAWQRPTPGTASAPLGYTMIANADYASAGIADHDIQIRNLAFDWNGYSAFGSAAIRFVHAESLLVQNARFSGNEDGTAFVGDDGAVVNGCTAVGTVNYAYDNWDGPRDTVIENSTASVSRFGGIALTGRGTGTADDATGSNDSVINDQIYGADTFGIDVDALSAGSALNDVFVSGNTIDGPGSGITLHGPGSGDVITGNLVAGSMGGSEIIAANLSPGPATGSALQLQNLAITGNTVSDALIDPGQEAAIVVQAAAATVAGNSVDAGSSLYALWVAGDDIIAMGDSLNDWNSQAVLLDWSSNATINDPAGSPATPLADQSGYRVDQGTITLHGSGTLDLRSQPSLAATQRILVEEGVGETVFLTAGPGVLLSVTDTVATVPQSLGDGAAGLATGLTIFGADAPDVIALGPGEDAVVVGGPDERLRGGGNDTFYVATATAAATIDGGHANSQIVVTGGGPVTLGSAITGIDTVRIVATRPTSLTLNAQPGVTAWASNAGDTLSAGGADQRLIAGLGSDVLVGSSAGGDVFAGRAAELASDTIENFTAGDAIDVTSVGIAGARFAEHVNDVPGLSTLFVLDGHDGMGVYVAGTIDPTLLHLADDGDHGVVLEQTPGLYTATSDAQIDHVLGLLATGASSGETLQSSTLFIGGYLQVGGTLTLKADLAPVSLDRGESLVIEGAGHTIDGNGWQGLTVNSGSVIVHDLAITGAEAGISLEAGAGTLRLESAGGFDGGVSLGGGTLDLAATQAAGIGAITFRGAATLRIEPGVAVANTIAAFAPGDTIDGAGITDGRLTYDSALARLTLNGDGGLLALQMPSGFDARQLTTSSEPDGTAIIFAACFAAGTLIATPAGAIPIEHLEIGGLVGVRDGPPRPIRWIGRRSYPAALVCANPQLRPVRIRAGALSGTGGVRLPCRDLIVSPAHAVLVDDMLISAGALVDDRTILREPPGPVHYLHIELDRHELLMAEGVWSESFIDQAGRALFQNAEEFARLYPAHATRAEFRLDRVEDGASLERVRRWLRGIARPPARGKSPMRGHIERVEAGMVEGWAFDPADPRSPVHLELVLDATGPLAVIANRYRTDLDHAGLADGCCGFRASLPPGARLLAARRRGDHAPLAGP